MCQLIEQVAIDIGMNPNDANYIFRFVTRHLITKLPALSQVIEDVFESENEEKIQEHLNKAIEIIQHQQWNEKFKDWLLPPQISVAYPVADNSIL